MLGKGRVTLLLGGGGVDNEDRERDEEMKLTTSTGGRWGLPLVVGFLSLVFKVFFEKKINYDWDCLLTQNQTVTKSRNSSLSSMPSSIFPSVFFNHETLQHHLCLQSHSLKYSLQISTFKLDFIGDHLNVDD